MIEGETGLSPVCPVGYRALMSQPRRSDMEVESKAAKVTSCPPAIAVGSEPSINTKLALKDAMDAWKAVHGEVPKNVEQKSKGNAIRNAAPAKVYDRIMKHTFIGPVNHRRANSLGAAFIDWLIANPGATEADIKASGHDLKHLRWDLKENKELFKVERG